MKQKGLMLSCMMFFCLVVGVFSANAEYAMDLETTKDGNADTVTSQFNAGDDLFLNILVTTPESKVAGCAFTLTYDATKLDAPKTTVDGLPENADEISTVFPFTTTVDSAVTKTHRINSTVGKILFSGAEITTEGGSKPLQTDVLFTVKFKIKSDATGTAIFGLEETVLNNAAAGWNGESPPVLIGAIPITDPNFGDDLSDDFPSLLTVFPDPAPSATITIGDVSEYDKWKAENGYDGTVKPDIGAEAADYDRDGYSNYDEMVNGSDPYVKEAATQFPASYNEIWDNRVSNLDVDGNGKASLGQDGMIALRYMAGKRGTALLGTSVDMDNSDGTICTRCDATAIEAYLSKIYNARPCPLDVDESGKPALGQDGMIILRYMAGKRGVALLGTSVAGNCLRCEAPEIEAWIKMLFPNAMR